MPSRQGRRRKRQPRIFLSYARADSRFVTLISEFLAPLPIPVFLDTKNITPGQKWAQRIVDEVEKATHVYVFWSRHAAASNWVRAELNLALKGEKVVVPVLIDDTPMPRTLSLRMAIDVRYVAGVNQGQFDRGYSSSKVSTGMRLLEALGIDVGQRRLEESWPSEGAIRADGFDVTDPRLTAIGMYGFLTTWPARSRTTRTA